MRTAGRTSQLARLLLAACLIALACGCEYARRVLGTDCRYLLTSFDALALPGETATVKVRVQEGTLLKDRAHVLVQFWDRDRCLGMTLTDHEGYAAIPFKPPAPGDYAFMATVAPGWLQGTPPPPAQVLVACREAAAPLAVIDLDKTIVASDTRTVLEGNPAPMPQSVEVLNRLARQYTIVYLTHRVDYIAPKTKVWLYEHGFPPGPLLAATIRESLGDSGFFKSARLGQLRQKLSGRGFGVGDKPSDAAAYHGNGLQPFLLLSVDPHAGARSLRKLANSLDALPDETQVVTGWRQIEDVLSGCASYPKLQAQTDLHQRAAALDHHAVTPPRKASADGVSATLGASYYESK